MYCHWVRGTANLADPISRLHDQFGGGLSLACEAATRRVGDLWAFLDCKTVFLWTLGVPMGPFVLPQSWQVGFQSYSNVDGAEFHDEFLQYCIEESMGVGWVVRCLPFALRGMPLCLHPSFFFAALLLLPVMTKRKGKRCDWGRRTHRRSPAAVARRHIRGGERLRMALRGLLARHPVPRVLLASTVKVFFQVDIPGHLAPAVLRDAACDIARRLHGAPAQAFRPEGTPNVKPLDQNHMCSHKWRVVYSLGRV